MKISDNIVIRTPLLPIDIDKMSEKSLFDLFKKEFIKEAIYLASPSFFSELEKYYNGHPLSEKEKKRVLMTYAKYVSRMQSRCTPFGLFATCSTACFDNQQNPILSDIEKQPESFRRKTRFDMSFLIYLSDYLKRNSALKATILYFPNQTIYSVDNKYRYIETKLIQKRRDFNVASVDVSDYLDKVLTNSQGGGTINYLMEHLVDSEITYEDAREFIYELIDNQILISELEPNVTGEDYYNRILKYLKRINSELKNQELEALIISLDKLKVMLEKLDKKFINNVEAYNLILLELKTFFSDYTEGLAFQCDTYRKEEQLSVDSEIKTELCNTVRFLNKLIPNSENTYLKTFREKFEDVYGDLEIPLLKALDSELGIGYPVQNNRNSNSLINDVSFIAENDDFMHVKLSAFQQIVFMKFIKTTKSGDYTIKLVDEDFKEIELSTKELPLTMAIHFELLEGGKKIYFKTCSGPSSSYMFGRFASANEDVTEILNQIQAHEAGYYKDKALAEILYLPDESLGNVIVRPILSEYEIPCLTLSVLNKERQITLNDLYLSVRNNKIILRSKKLGVEVIPRLSSAHNYFIDSLPVYRFLGELQLQYSKKVSLNFDWGNLAEMTTFLPRVEYKNTILSLATWNLKEHEFALLNENTEENTLSKIKEWKNGMNLPDRVLLNEGDNTLLIDFNNELSMRLFLNFIKNKQKLSISEFPHGKDGFLKDSSGSTFTNEIVAVLLNEVPPSTNIYHAIESSFPKSHFYPGSEWCYYKIYCSSIATDKILSNSIHPLITSLKEQAIIKKWFFIRYDDNGSHIRLRFQLEDINKLDLLIKSANAYLQPQLENGLINKMQIDSYVRELDRYGYENIEYVESLFQIDCEVYLKFLELLDVKQTPDLKILFAVRSLYDYLRSAGLSFDESLACADSITISYLKEFSFSKSQRISLDNKYRKMRKDIDGVLFNVLASTNSENLLLQLSQIRINSMQTITKILFSPNIKKMQIVQQINLLSSLNHMMINRVFDSKQREHELIAYYLLHKALKSRQAINKKLESSVITQ